MRQSKVFALILVLGNGERLLSSEPIGTSNPAGASQGKEPAVPGYRFANAEDPRVVGPPIRGRSAATPYRVAIPIESPPIRFEVANNVTESKFTPSAVPAADLVRLEYRTLQPINVNPIASSIAPPILRPTPTPTVAAKPSTPRKQGPQAIAVWHNWGEWQPN